MFGRHSRWPHPALLLIAAIAFASIGIGTYVQVAVQSVREDLPVNLLAQTREAAEIVKALDAVGRAVEAARERPAPETLEALRGKAAAARLRVDRLHTAFAFDNLIGVSAIHGVADPALIDIERWLAGGVHGYPAGSPQVLRLVQRRAEEAYSQAESLEPLLLERAQDLVRENSRRLEVFRRSVSILLGFLALLVLGAAGIVMLLIRSDRNAQAAGRRLNEAIEAIPDGFALFDSDERLVLCNRRYREIFPRIADLAVPGAHAAELMRVNATRGGVRSIDGGVDEWVARRMARRRDPRAHGFELIETSEGRWIHATEWLTQDGGILSVRTDITEIKRREAEIRENEARYRQLVEHMPVAIFVIRDGVVAFANPACAQIIGADTPERLIGMPIMNLVHPDWREFATRRVRGILENREPAPVRESRFLRLDGTTVPVEVSGVPFTYEGKPAIQVVLRDLTEMRRAEEALRKQARIIEQSLNEIYIFDAQTLRFTMANQGARENLQYSMAELEGLTPVDIKVDHDRDSFEALIAPLRDGSRDMITFESIHRRKDGTTYDVEIRLQLMSAESPPVFAAMALDISDRRRAEMALRLTQFAVDKATDAVFWLGSEGRFFYVNDAASQMLGYSREELIGRSVWDVNTTLRPELWERFWAKSKRKSGGVVESELRRKDGETFPVEITYSHMAFAGVEYLFTFTRDIAKRRETERLLLAAKEQAELANRAKTEFLANVSHELRTPLNAIIGFSEIMSQELFGPIGSSRYAAYVGDIRESGAHLLQLISDILDVARVESGEVSLSEQEINIPATLDSALRLVFGRADRARVTLASSTPEDLPGLLADGRMVKQILINLLANAIKFTPEGGRIEASARRTPDGGLALVIRDTGVGMAPELIPVALTPFRQIENVFTRTHAGTGLGLPLVKSLVELHDGDLRIDSAPGEGTTVTVTFPPSRVLRDVDAPRLGAARG